MIKDKDVGKIFTDLTDNKLYLLFGYTIKDNVYKYVLVYLTQFYIGKDFIYNKNFNIDGYFDELKYNLMMKPLERFVVKDTLNLFEPVDAEVYDFEPDLFKIDELKLWYTKSRLSGTLNFDMFFNLKDVQKEVEHLNQLKKEENKRNLDLKLANLDLLVEEDIRIGNVYNNPVNNVKLLYFGKNQYDRFVFAVLTAIDYKNLSTLNETRVYQIVLNLVKTKIKLYKNLPKLEKESILFVPLYTYESSMNYKLAIKKYGL